MNTRATRSCSPVEHVKTLKKPPALQAIDSYSGFVTNQVFEKCRPFEVLVYATVQYLSFHSIKPSCRNIIEHVNLTVSATKKALCSLRNERYIEKQADNAYLFGNTKQDGSMELLGAKEITDARFGYWFPLNILKSKKINNPTKRAFALILNLIKTGSSQIRLSYIAEKLDLSERAASPLIHHLLAVGLISRDRNHCRSAYFYQIGAKTMGTHKKDLSTVRGNNSVNSDQGTPDFRSNGTPDFRSFSIKGSSISIVDNRTERESDHIVSRESEFHSLEEASGHILSKVEYLEKEAQEIAQEFKSLDQQYTDSCINQDWQRMTKIGNKIAHVYVKKRTVEGEAEKGKGIISDYLYMLNKKQMPMLKQHHINQIGSAIKAALPEFSDAKLRRRAFCLKMNSVLCDVESIFHKINEEWHYQSRQEATMSRVVRDCLTQAQSNDCLNEKVSMGFGQMKSASNDSK